MSEVSVEYSAKVARLPIYPAAEGYGDADKLVLLASNETPYAPLPQVVQAAADAVQGANRYPDPSNTELRKSLSERYGVPASQIAAGNGSCDILLAAGDALLEPGSELAYAWPSFSIYPHITAATGATSVQVPLDSADRHDLGAIKDAITERTRLVIVCNPNNPTSTAVPLREIEAVVAAIPPRVVVILDEAYCEFNSLDDPDASIALLAAHPNLVLLRTFSKVYGLSGMRIGFALCGSEQFREAVDQVRQPFFTSVAAQAAAVEALKYPEAVRERVSKTIAARDLLEAGLRELGFDPADSQANHVWFSLADRVPELDVMRGLKERRVVVRAGTALGRSGYLRVTVGHREQNETFLNALSDVLKTA